MADSKIAALRAASSERPAAPSGPQALAYPWMTAAGRELVMPVRSPPPASPKARRPPDPSATPAQDFMKSKPPPDPSSGLPPGFRRGRDGGRETQDMPGFVDGVTLPEGYNPRFTYNPDLMNAFTPREGGQNLMYGGMVPENPSAALPSEEAPAAPEAPPFNVNMDLGLLEYLQPQRLQVGPSSPSVELPPDPTPYQPGIVEPVAAPAPAAAPSKMEDFVAPPWMAAMQMPAPPPAVTQQPAAMDAQFDPQLLEFLAPQRRIRGPVAR